MRYDKKNHTIDVSTDFASKRAYSAKTIDKCNNQYQKSKNDPKIGFKNKVLQLASTFSTLPMPK
jgi:hypothetical protein